MLDVAFDELDAGIFGPAQRQELRAEVEADTIEALPMEQIGEHARAAAEIGDPGAGVTYTSRGRWSRSGARCSPA